MRGSEPGGVLAHGHPVAVALVASRMHAHPEGLAGLGSLGRFAPL